MNTAMNTAAPGYSTVDGAAQRPRLLLIGTGMRRYREYLLRSLPSAYRVHLFLPAEPTWETGYCTGWTTVDPLDGEAMAEAAVKLATDEPIAGVLCWDEGYVHAAARVAEALGLPGGNPDAVLRCRDKHRTRVALAAAGVDQPRSRTVATVEQALAFAGEVGYPAILKPRGLAASVGVVLVHDPAELAARFPATIGASLPGAPPHDTILVEEYVQGPEISVDAAVHAGRCHPLFLARKVVGYEPYFEEVGHYVDAADPLLHSPELARILQSVHSALGYTDGVTHTELKLTTRGPKVIEVNARLGGDLIPYLGSLATGVDPALVAAAIACGQLDSPAPARTLVAGVRFFYVDRADTTIDAVEFDRDRLPPAIRVAEPMVDPGAVVSPPPKGMVLGRIGYAVGLAPTIEECRSALADARTVPRVAVSNGATVQ